jgi:hypothetical protein
VPLDDARKSSMSRGLLLAGLVGFMMLAGPNTNPLSAQGAINPGVGSAVESAREDVLRSIREHRQARARMHRDYRYAYGCYRGRRIPTLLNRHSTGLDRKHCA